jgi:serine/threonine protein kinase
MDEKRRIECKWISGVESLEKYEPGGYHPIMIGDILHDRYHIADKLGQGGYSTVWLAQDTYLKQYVALKVNIASSVPREAKVLKALSAPHSVPSQHPGRDLISSLLDEFEVQGPNGTHMCHTVTLAACSLRDVSFNHLLPLDIARALSYGLTQAVAYIHSQGYVHGGKV